MTEVADVIVMIVEETSPGEETTAVETTPVTVMTAGKATPVTGMTAVETTPVTRMTDGEAMLLTEMTVAEVLHVRPRHLWPEPNFLIWKMNEPVAAKSSSPQKPVFTGFFYAHKNSEKNSCIHIEHMI